MPLKTNQEIEMPGPQPWDVPAGGIDVPILPGPKEGEAERFPGEFKLSPEERNRWLILHFAIPRTIMTCDMAEKRSTEAELNDVLSTMCWGSVEEKAGDWILECEGPTFEPPDSSLITYAEFMNRAFPTNAIMEEEVRTENIQMAAQKRVVFTNPGEPGAKLRPVFDQLVKNLQHSNKSLMKAFELKKPILNEEDVPDDPSRPDAQVIMRFGRYQVLPSFWQLLTHLAKKNRRFSIVFRSFNEEQLATVQRELLLFCQGQHPAYNGKNKTQKPPPMNGEKGSRDMRLLDAGIGKINREVGKLEFPLRPAGEAPKLARPGEAATVVGSTPPAEGTEPTVAEDTLEGGAATTGETSFVPTEYLFPDFHEFYAGLQHQVLAGVNTAAIIDDLGYWKNHGSQADAGKLLLVDYQGGPADTTVQHVCFDGNVESVDVRNVVDGEPIPQELVDGMLTHRVDLCEAISDVDYFVNALDNCEQNFSKKVLEARSTSQARDVEKTDVDKVPQEPLPAKQYLYKNIIPALLPALEACQRDRPADPIEFIAFYMLRHPKQYSKTLKA